MRLDDMILISIDDHSIEPPDMYDRHVPAKWRDQAPKIVRDENGIDHWVFQGEATSTRFGLAATVGWPAEEWGLDAGSFAERLLIREARFRRPPKTAHRAHPQIEMWTTHPIDVWVDDNGYVRQYESSYDETLGGNAMSTTTTVEISDYGTQVDISPPPADEVFDATELATKGISSRLGGSTH